MRSDEISDVGALSGLSSLGELYLDNNQISDISALSGLSRLFLLYLGINQISDVSALNGLANLTNLRLNTNQISDVSALSGLTGLLWLHLDNNQISDINALSELTGLFWLNLENNQINDVSALNGLANLTSLRLNTNQISDVSALSGLTELSFLDLEYNQISDISALIGLTELSQLDVSHNHLFLGENSQALADIDNIRNTGRRSTFVTFEPQNLDIFQGQPINGVPGWLASSWYLDYNIEFWPWIYHDEHGWQFVDPRSTEEVIFLWDLGLGQWIFLNENSYRWIFIFGAENAGWVFTFSDNKPGRRFFQRLDGSLFSVPPDLPVN